jgi:hypothetical protein
MMRFIRPRLRKPVGIALAGTAYAAAWLVHGGSGWLWAIVAELSVIAFAISTYVRGGRGIPASRPASAGDSAAVPAGRSRDPAIT